MAEYIERETAVKAAEHAYNEWNLAMAAADGRREINLVYKRQELCKAVASVFEIAPAADVAPVVHGKWKPVKYNAHCACGKSYGTYHFLCSACNHIAYSQPYGLTYCPHCGALMDGGQDV